MHVDGDTRAGMIGGTLVVILLNAFNDDALRSALLAFVGATVSFFCFAGMEAGSETAAGEEAKKTRETD